MKKQESGGTATLSFSALGVQRKTQGLRKQATRGVRMSVVATLAAAGAAGVEADKIAQCWPSGAGTIDKVGQCMRILAGDDYGYQVQRQSHPTSRGLDRYRIVGDTEVPAGEKPEEKEPQPKPKGRPAGGSEAADVLPPLDPEVEKVAREAIDSGDHKAWVKEHVDPEQRGAIRSAIRRMLVD